MQQLLNTLATVRPHPITFRSYPAAGFTRHDYDSTVESVAANFIEKPGVLAVYQYGSVSAPGISDIDFVVVLDPAATIGISQFRIAQFGGIGRYLTKHPALVMSREHAKRFQCWDIYKPELLAGDDCISLEFPNVLQQSLYLELALDRTFQIYPRHLLRLFLQPKPDARDILTSLYSLRYVVELLERALIPLEGQKEVLDAVVTLRNEWFRLPRVIQDSQLDHLLRRGICVGFGLIASICGVLCREQRSECRQLGEFLDFDCLSVFEEPWDPLRSLKSTMDRYSTTAALVMHFPGLYLSRLAEYASNRGASSDYFQRQLRSYGTEEIQPPESLRKVWMLRAEFLNSHIDWLERNGYQRGDSLNGNENALSGGLRGFGVRMIKQRILGWLAFQGGATSVRGHTVRGALALPVLRMASAAYHRRSRVRVR